RRNGDTQKMRVDARLPQVVGPSGGLREGIGVGVENPGYPGVDKRLRAGTRAPGVVARLEGDHRGAATGTLPRGGQRHDLGMRPTGWLRGTDTGDLTARVQDDGTDRRVRAGGTDDLLGCLDGQLEGLLGTHGVYFEASARSSCTAALGSPAPKTAEPATKASTPASAACSMVVAEMPPSISMMMSSPRSSMTRR